MIQVATYARYSSDNQRAASIEDQQRNCKRRAELEGWRIVREFADAAMSGSDGQRPQYRAMIAAANRGEFQILLIDDLSRLTRDSIEQERTIRGLEFHGVRIIAVSDGYDSENKGRKIQRGFKGLMNEVFLDDLREKVHRGQEGQARKGRWNGGRPYGYRLKPITDPNQRDAYDQPAQIGTKLECDQTQAKIVRLIFERFANGASCQTIAKELNARGVPSPGSSWKRKIRRAAGWMGSGVRVILKNPLYTGLQGWNRSKFVLNPGTEKIIRRKRPKSEWVVNQDESLRIVSDELFADAQRRTKDRSDPSKKLKTGGKPKYLLSGRLKCGACGANYILSDARSYACSSYMNGCCSNGARVRRDALETIIVGEIKDELLSPNRAKRLAAEMQKRFQEGAAAAVRRKADVPRELSELDARLDRLRERLRKGDPDLTDDELQVAINRAQSKRGELAAAQSSGDVAKIISMLPRAAEIYRKAIADGLEGKPDAMAKARVILRDLLGDVQLRPKEDGSLWAEYQMRPAVLLRAAGTCGRGDRI
jgi:site-specific DNA recombinase